MAKDIPTKLFIDYFLLLVLFFSKNCKLPKNSTVSTNTSFLMVFLLISSLIDLKDENLFSVV